MTNLDFGLFSRRNSRPARTKASSVVALGLLAVVVVVGACGRSTLGPFKAGGNGESAGGGGDASTESSATTASGSSATDTGGGGTASGGSSSSGIAGAGGAGGTGSGTTGGGGNHVCSGSTDCDDKNSCTTDLCDESGSCEWVPRDDDDDGHVAEICGGNDCNDLNPNAFPGHAEVCTDGSDNDCNGIADCFDPACEDVPTCGCVPAPGGENCTNGVDDDCDTTVDCNDPGCVGTPACGCSVSEAGKCDNGVDDDCDGDVDCDDSSCFSTDVCQCQATQEQCGNGADDDCDLLIDCADPNCNAAPFCICAPPGSPESCFDGIDNDCDVLVDCADPDCVLSPACIQCTAEICDDGKDNNCDNKIDCADTACFFDPKCVAVPEICNNSLDDDHDTLIDCSDPDCATSPNCVLAQANCLSPKLIAASGSHTGDTTGHIHETKGSCGGDAGEAVFYLVLNEPSRVHLDSIGTSFDSTLYVRAGSCADGHEIGCDDDSAGSQWAAKLDFTILYPGIYFVFLDGYTVDPEFGPNEGSFVLNVEIDENPAEQCTDGKDNDGDIFVDCADSDCTNVGGCLNCAGGSPPAPEFGIDVCADGKDNDCDGVSDCADDDCSASDYYVTECCDGDDDNDNGIPDDFNCRCASDADCTFGEICYTHTAYACGIECDLFFGDVCPFVAAGSYCNTATHQCEF